jgi:hypothetical protein
VDTAKLAIEIQKNKDGLVTNEEVEQKVRALMQGEEGQCIKRNVVKMQERQWQMGEYPNRILKLILTICRQEEH